MLVQLVKELFLLLFWRELAYTKKEGPFTDQFGFKPKTKPGFEIVLVASSWALAIFLLSVSVPHSFEIIYHYEKGSEQFRELKSILLAITIEVIAALVLLIALHTKKLSEGQRNTLYLLGAPFVVLTLHLQFVYYAGPEQWIIYPWELAAVLPGGVLVCAVLVAFLWPLLTKGDIVEQPKPTPQIVTSAADGGTVEPILDLRELLEETEPVLVGVTAVTSQPKLTRSEIARKAAAKRWEKKEGAA